LEVSKLNPYLTYKPWGGEKLLKFKAPENLGANVSDEPLGETWEISRHKDGVARLEDGRSLDTIFTNEQLPYLVKLIDTSGDLSIQAHPDDDYAAKNENDQGKTECWLILDAAPNAGIYLGLKPGVTKHNLEEAIKKSQAVNELLNFYEVKPGDFFYVSPGSIHAIGKNVTLAEVQQSSGITYRVWDWNRVDAQGKSRELHIKQALDVINFEEEKNSMEFFNYSQNNLGKNIETLVEHRDFSASLFHLNQGEKLSRKINGKRATSILVVNGEGEFNGCALRKYESGICLALDGELKVTAQGDMDFILIS
jgi:mannose-6-phosphate isomerase